MAKLKNLLSNPQKIANLKVAALCFLAAATFWVLNALNKDNYTTVVDYPIEIIFDDEEFMPVKPLPSRIKIEINGNGWDLLRKYFNINENPFLIEINNPATKNYLLTADIRRSLAESLGPTSLVSMVTDSIKFEIDKVVTRKIRVLPDTSGNTIAKNHRLVGQIEIDPEIINIKGPTSILQELDGKLLVDLGEEKVNKNFNKLIPIQSKQEHKNFLTLEEESVSIKFEVIQLLEGNKRLKIKRSNFPPNVDLVQEPAHIIMSYLIDERKVSDLGNYEFEAILNYNNRNREDSSITVQVNPKPAFLENIRFEPSILKLKYE